MEKPKGSWAVKNDGSKRFKNTVIRYLNTNHGSRFAGFELLFYGIDRDGQPNYLDEKQFDVILTIEEFVKIFLEVTPKKLIRKKIINKLKEGEWEEIEDLEELNKLYSIKVREELAEIQESKYLDIMEFADLVQVVFSFAKINGFTHEQLAEAVITKSLEKGTFGKTVLNNLNPANPSNKLYFEQP